ncbi:MAG TPA: hypothetical protein VFD91_03550 [Mariniphaga sp.]|nr:hypothetical protein [Mariniphaga sp.]
MNRITFYTKGILTLILLSHTVLFSGCTIKPESSEETDASAFLTKALSDTSDFYYNDLSKIDQEISTSSPIGVFDSGTGGLTVLDAILNFDNYDTTKYKYHYKGDGIRDFKDESFVYFGDQANMPYGNYSTMNKTSFLKELILRDALFLLGDKWHKSDQDTVVQENKEPVKLIVVACNTATAYGKEDIQEMMENGGSNIPVIGVIDAGIRGALSTFEPKENGTAAVIATAGTVSSNGYLNTFISQSSQLNYEGELNFLQQSGYGIAEAIDEELNFIDRKATAIRKNYQGPSMTHELWKIKEELLPVYQFDTIGNALLVKKENGKLAEIQLNSAENYIRYHLVNLCEQLKEEQVSQPLKTLILGCTHYPYYSSFFQATLNDLYNLKLDDEFVYREYLNDSIILIDPAINTAKEVHEYLLTNNLLNKNTQKQPDQFYISVPDLFCEVAETDSSENFTYEYKYNRNVNHVYDTRHVPMGNNSVNHEVLNRIEKQMPEIYERIINFENEAAR